MQNQKINVITNGKNFYDQPIDSNIKRYEGIRKLTTGQGDDYTTGCLLDHDYIKNHYRLISPGNKMSWRRCSDVPLHVVTQIRLK